MNTIQMHTDTNHSFECKCIDLFSYHSFSRAEIKLQNESIKNINCKISLIFNVNSMVIVPNFTNPNLTENIEMYGFKYGYIDILDDA